MTDSKPKSATPKAKRPASSAEPVANGADFEIDGWKPVYGRKNRNLEVAASNPVYGKRATNASPKKGLAAIGVLIEAAKELQRQELLWVSKGKIYVLIPAMKRTADGQWIRVNRMGVAWRPRR